MRTHLFVLAGLGSVLVLGLSGCTQASSPHIAGSTPAKPTGSHTFDFTSATKPVWSDNVHPVGEPATVGDVIVSYFSDAATGLQVGAWNLETGRQLWTDAAATGAVTPGVELDADTVSYHGKNYVDYLAPKAGSGWQVLAVADAATGQKLEIPNSLVWATDRPASCQHETGVCLAGELSSSQPASRALRYDFATNMISADPQGAIPANARMLGSGVFSTNDRPSSGGVEMLGYSAGGKVQWEQPYTTAFGPGYSSDAGWNWAGDDTKYAVGTGLAYQPSEPGSAEFTVDLTRQRAVALDRKTGAVIWSMAGTGPCPFSEGIEITKDLVELCRWRSGTATARSATALYSHEDLDMLGVNVASGKPVWTVHLRSPQDPPIDRADMFAKGAKQQVINVGDKPMVIDLTSGDLTTAPAAGVYLCKSIRSPVLADYPGEPSDTSTSPSGKTPFDAGFAIQTCNVSQKPLAAKGPSPSALRMSAAAAGQGYYVVSGAAALTVYRLPS